MLITMPKTLDQLISMLRKNRVPLADRQSLIRTFQNKERPHPMSWVVSYSYLRGPHLVWRNRQGLIPTPEYGKLREAARSAITRALSARRLPSLKTQEIPCVDCGQRARQYDHRDYRKPAEVDPVCIACNQRRGPALPSPTWRGDRNPKPPLDRRAMRERLQEYLGR